MKFTKGGTLYIVIMDQYARGFNITKPPGYLIVGDIEYYLERLRGVKGKILEAGVGSIFLCWKKALI